MYRIAALYAASRVVIAIKRGRDDYDASTRLSEEEPTGRTLTLLIQYSRPILVAVYTHLLRPYPFSPLEYRAEERA